MPFYAEDLVEEVRSRSNIVEVVSGYVKLQKKGNRYFGLCPFHNEKSPSFSVTPEKGMYYCYGCGAGGDVFSFLMEYENFTFSEAMQTLAERAGVALPVQDDSPGMRRRADRKQRLLEVNKEAATYYYMLLRGMRGRMALDYFKKRGLSDATMHKFGLGYSDKFGDDLYRYLKQKGYDDELLKDSGLITYDERRGGRDKFWNRAMFPIMDVRGKVTGFGGRVMGDGEPKYLNSPETEIFDKSRTLYGLHLARTTKKPQILLCEGYMDVIALHQAGFDNAAASLGTAFTAGHAGLLGRYTKEVYLTYDSDAAGVKAALRALPILKGAGIKAKVIDMQPYKDPDEFIKALGAEAYQERINRAENGFLFEIRMLEREYDLHDPEGRTSFYQAIARRLLEFDEGLERDNYIEAVAKTYQIGYEKLRKLVFSMGMRGMAGAGEARAAQSGVSRLADTGKNGRGKKKGDGIKQSQKLLLTCLIEHAALFSVVETYIAPSDFTEDIYRVAAEALYEQYRKEGRAHPDRIVGMFEEEEKKREIAELFHARVPDIDTKEAMEKVLKETVVRIKQNSIQMQSSQLAPTDLAGLQKLVEDKRQLEQLEKLHISIE